MATDKTSEDYDGLVSTSVHLPSSYVKRIIKLGVDRSKYIRDAVGVALERDYGFVSEIEIIEAKRERLKEEDRKLGDKLSELYEKHHLWRIDTEKERIQDIAIGEYMIGNYQTEIQLHAAIEAKLGDPNDQLMGTFGNKFKYKDFVRDVVSEVWKKVKGSESQDA